MKTRITLKFAGWGNLIHTTSQCLILFDLAYFFIEIFPLSFP